MRKPIHKAISEVLKNAGRPLSAEEIYDAIVEEDLYHFNAQDPLHIVKSQLRRHCKEIDFPSARRVKYFTVMEDGRYGLLAQPVKMPSSLYKVQPEKASGASSTAVVTVPPREEEGTAPEASDSSQPSHTEIQGRLLALGSTMGLSVWAPMSDRGKAWSGGRLAEIPKLLSKLPRQFDEATNKTIEYIDVLWMDGHAIIAGFEVEHTSTIYSGLLRMSDLVTMQPNLEIKLYLTAPDERFSKFAREIGRPTFSRRPKPLHSMCRFLPYGSLIKRLTEAQNLIRHLRPNFLDDVAEAYDPTAEFED